MCEDQAEMPTNCAVVSIWNTAPSVHQCKQNIKYSFHYSIECKCIMQV